MIADYKNLKKHCEIPYSVSVKLKDGKIKDREFKVGDLRDTQLEIAKQKLERKSKLNEEESKQLDAVNYVIQYRSKCAIEGLQSDINSKRIDKANKIANIVSLWGDQIGNKIKELPDKPFYQDKPKVKIRKPLINK